MMTLLLALATTVAAPLGSFLGAYIGWRGAFFCVVPLAAVTLGWLFATLRGAGLELSTISLATVPFLVAWAILGLALGRTQERLSRPGELP